MQPGTTLYIPHGPDTVHVSALREWTWMAEWQGSWGDGVLPVLFLERHAIGWTFTQCRA